MRALAALLVLTLAACSSPTGAPGTTPDFIPSPSTGASTESTACQGPRDPTPAPAGESITAAIGLGCEAGGVAIAGESVWVVPHLDRVGLRIDPMTNTVVDRVPLGDRGPGAEIAATNDMIWASVSSRSYDYERLVRIDPGTGAIVAWVDAAAGFPVIGADFVWATGPRRVYRIDPTTNTLGAVIETGFCMVITLYDRVFCVGPDLLVAIDPTTEAVSPWQEPRPGGRSRRSMA